MRNIILIILITLLTACGGAEFNAPAGDFGGEAGAPDVTVGGETVTAGTGGHAAAGMSAGGSSSSGGKQSATGGSAGTMASAGSMPGGAAGDGGAAGSSGGSSGGAGAPPMAGSGGGGGVPAMCEFDVAKLTAALPSVLVWQDFTYTSGADCVTCRDTPCGTLPVISWGVPLVMPDGMLFYQPNTQHESFSVNYGVNDGMCTKTKECGVTAGDGVAVQLQVARTAQGWRVSSVKVDAGVSRSPCAPPNFDGHLVMSDDFNQEVEKRLETLEIGCAK